MRREALGGIAGMLVLVVVAIGFGGSNRGPMTRSQAAAALRGDHFRNVSSASTWYLPCTSHTMNLNAAPAYSGGRVGSTPLPAYRVNFTDPRLPGTDGQLDLLPDAGQASLCVQGGIYALRHVREGGIHDSPTPRFWPTHRINTTTVEAGFYPGYARYYVFLSRGRMLATGTANTRFGAALVEQDLEGTATQLAN
ncbi:MAG: hypothetical protein ACTHNU_06920 [Gaiellales bacterium]